MGAQSLALLAALNVECASVDQLAEAASEAFRQHRDHEIVTSFPGLADVTGARVLAEIGDDRTRFAYARASKAYAGSAPVTRASGRSISITHRKVKNDRLAAAGYIWSFVAATHAEPAKQHYQRRRNHGDRHPAALRNLFNKLLGCLHHCLSTGQLYDPVKAFTLSRPAYARRTEFMRPVLLPPVEDRHGPAAPAIQCSRPPTSSCAQ